MSTFCGMSVVVDFVTKVSVSRHLKLSEAHAAAEGRVWTGVDAARMHLVDQVGTFRDALEKAKSMADPQVDKVTVVFEKPTSPFAALLKSLRTASRSSSGDIFFDENHGDDDNSSLHVDASLLSVVAVVRYFLALERICTCSYHEFLSENRTRFFAPSATRTAVRYAMARATNKPRRLTFRS